MRLALAGDPGASVTVGAQLLYGTSRPKDEQLGRRLLEQAHAAGLASATACLADVYRQGLGVPVDKRRALGLLEHAARQGHAYCALDAARMLRDGELGQPDPSRARAYFGMFLQMGADGEEGTPEWAEAEAFVAANP